MFLILAGSGGQGVSNPGRSGWGQGVSNPGRSVGGKVFLILAGAGGREFLILAGAGGGAGCF